MFNRRTLELIWEEEIRLYHGRYVHLCSHNSPFLRPFVFELSDPLYDIRHETRKAEEKPTRGRTFRMVADLISGKIWYESVGGKKLNKLQLNIIYYYL